MRLGIISDTHGFLPDRVLDTFHSEGVDQILHAGDIGPLSILARLEACAPVTAVQGNCDFPSHLNLTERLKLEGVVIHLAHRPQVLERAMRSDQTPDTMLGIHGHLHIPSYTTQSKNRFILCPGSPTEPRNSSKPSIALVELQQGTIPSHEFITV